jgi:ribosomal protein L11 methylase PrmA
VVAESILIGIVLLVVALGGAYFVFASFGWGAGYQPTPRRSAEAMLRLAEVGPRDLVYDLGAGTGAIVFRAARIYRARAVAVEVEPLRVLILRARRALGPFPDRVTVVWRDFFRMDFRPATVVTAFLWPGAMARLGPKLVQELPEGARVVSYYHPMPGWTAELHDTETDVYLYRVPRRPAAVSTGGN